MDQTTLKTGQLYWVRSTITEVVEVARFTAYKSQPGGWWDFVGSDECSYHNEYIALAECNPPPDLVK